MKKTNKKSILILSIILPLLIIGLFVAWKVGRLKIGADITTPVTTPVSLPILGIILNKDTDDAAAGIKIILSSINPQTIPFADLNKDNAVTTDENGMFKIISLEKNQAKQRLTVYSGAKKYYDGILVFPAVKSTLMIQISDLDPAQSNAIILTD